MTVLGPINSFILLWSIAKMELYLINLKLKNTMKKNR